MTTKESEVDVLNAMKHAVSVLHGVADDGADTRRYADNLHASSAAVAEVFEAANRVLSHRVGDLPNLGYIRDNGESRIAIAMFVTALRNAGVKV